MAFFGLKLLKNLKFAQNLLTINKMGKQNKRKQKRGVKEGK